MMGANSPTVSLPGRYPRVATTPSGRPEGSGCGLRGLPGVNRFATELSPVGSHEVAPY
jgi:hypothetical protein